jgi:hypothetical protein
MAIPTSGALSMKSIAQEALYGTWESGTITGPISIYDMINGGNSHGSGNSYPTVNTACTPNPADRGTYNSFTIYDGTGGTTTLYTTVALTAVTTGTIIYSNVSGSVYTGGGGFIQGPSGITWFTNCTDCPAITTNTTTGAVTATSCSCP